MTIQELPAELESVLSRIVLGNSVRNWVIAAIVFAGTVVVLGIVQRIVVLRLKRVSERTATDVDDLVVDLLRRTKGFFLVALALFLAHHWLSVSPKAARYIEAGVRMAVWVQAGLWAIGIVEFAIARMVRGKSGTDPARTMGASILGFIGRACVWILIFLLCLQALGQPVGTLLASLGVGGIAVALALQNILGDLFASVAILLDKPFVIGDVITLGEFQGTVQRIGIKTTRLRSISGEEIVIGNNDLVSSRVRNFRRMQKRRQVFTLGITYQTPPEKLEAIPRMLEEIVGRAPKATFDRAHFKSFGDFALLFEVVYLVDGPEMDDAMDAQHHINLEIHERFEREGIEFAYPTQTVIQVPLAGARSPVPPGEPRGDQKELSRG